VTLVDNGNNTNPYLNLALEEFLVRHADCSATDYLLLYINQPCFVLGKNQSIYKEVNFDFLRNQKLLAARRISGGGTVYHDEGNVNFAFISKFEDKKVNNYRWFNEPLIKALNKAGIPAETDPRNNIICNGKKISGNAQFTDRKNIISHGTLLFNAELNLLRACLAENNFKVETKAVPSIKSSVINISEINHQFKTAIELKDYLASELGTSETKRLTKAEWQQIEKNAGGKFQSFEWIYGRSPATLIKKNDLEIEVEDGKIRSIKTSLKLADLTGVHYSFETIKKALADDANASEILSLIF
jgi:lipoate-protein ligase A